jgi:hypothetical protein
VADSAAAARMDLAAAQDHMPVLAGEGTPARFPLREYMAFRSQVKIITKDAGLAFCPQLGSQRYMIEQIAAGLDAGKTDFKVLKARQLGITTELRILAMFWLFKHPGMPATYVVHEDRAREAFRQALNSYAAHLPKSHKWPAILENRTMLLLSNESSLIYLVAGTKERAVGMGRAGSFAFLLADEVAFWGTPDDIKQFEATLSFRNPNRLSLWASTANGFNHFQEMWASSVDSVTSAGIFIGWYRHEGYRFERGSSVYDAFMPGGVSGHLTKLEERKVNEVHKLYGLEITREQIAWYRWYLSEKCGGDQTMMDQEHPWVPDDAFIASGSKYFSTTALTNAMRRARNVPMLPFRYSIGDSWFETDLISGSPKNADLRIWEEPQPNGKYVIGCDPAFGSSDLADRSVISVWRCFADRCSQVAEFASNQFGTHVCAWVVAHLAGYYKDALVVLEISGPGQDVKNELDRLKTMMANTIGLESSVLENMRSFIYRRADAMSAQGSWHLKMNYDLKWLVCSSFKASFETRNAVINSGPLLDEMKTLQIKDGSLNAAPHKKDDRVIAACYAHHGWRQVIQPEMIAEGRTFEREINPETRQANLPVELAVLNYLRGLNIGVATE